jgi:DNA invertase Pin-like site-specific DNA recombinase
MTSHWTNRQWTNFRFESGLLNKTNDCLNNEHHSETMKNPKEMNTAPDTLLLNRQTATKRVVVYARVSTKDQETENQLAQLRQYALSQGWNAVQEIVDVCSGSKTVNERSGLNKVFGLAHRKQFDIVLFWSLDRFSREGSRQTIAYLTQLESYGVGFHSYSEPYLSTLGIFSDSIIALLSALAKQERIRIGERTRAGLERAKANGKRLGRPRVAAEKIQQAKQLRADRLSYGEIGKRLGVSRVRAFQLCKDAA